MGMMDGKVAVVTGAGGGIGRATALELADNGAMVVVNDIGGTVTGEGRDAGPAERVVAEITQKHGKGRAIANAGSVSSWDDAQRMVQDAIDNFGRIDMVVNNAGILRDRMFHYMSIEEWDAVIKVHLYGAFYVSRAAVPHFRKQESGAYVHITSTSGLIGSVGQTNYGAAKMGIAGLSRNIAMDMQRYNIRSNCIGPHAFSRMIETVPGQTEEQMKTSSSNGVMDSDDTEEVSLSSVTNIQEELKSRANLGKSGGDAYESDEDDEMGPRGSQRVQCAQQ